MDPEELHEALGTPSHPLAQQFLVLVLVYSVVRVLDIIVVRILAFILVRILDIVLVGNVDAEGLRKLKSYLF